MHRERKRDIAVILLVGAIILPLEYLLTGWIGVLLFSLIMLSAFLLMPPEVLYMRGDVLRARQEMLNRLEGVQTIIFGYMDEKERMMG